MRTNIFHKSKSVAALASGAITATTNGTSVDLYQGGAGDYRTALFVIQAGAITDGDAYTVTLEHSDDSSAWEAAPARGTAAFVLTDDNAVKDLGYDGQKRYVRCVITATGTITTGGVFGAVAVLYDSAGYQR